MNQKMNSLSWTRWKKISTRIALRIIKVIFNWVSKVIQDLFTFLCDWSRKIVPLNQPIRCKTNTNLDLVASVFPRFAWLACSYSEFSLALRAFSFRMIGSWNYCFFFFTTFSRKALYLIITVMILIMIMI